MTVLFFLAALAGLGYLVIALLRVKDYSHGRPYDPRAGQRQFGGAAAVLGAWIVAISLHGNGTTAGQILGWFALAASGWICYRLHVDLSYPRRARPGSRLVTLADTRIDPRLTRRARLALWLGIPDRRYPA